MTDKTYIADAIERGRHWSESDVFLSDVEIIRQFIDTESYGLKYDEQGLIYPSYHYEIKRIMGTAMNNFSDLEKKYTFYYALNLRNLYNIHQKNYEHFKAAFALLLPRIYTREVCFGLHEFNPGVAFVLFNGIDHSIDDENKFEDISFSDFKIIYQFAKKCHSYWTLESMIEKKEQLYKYLDNSALMGLIEKNFNNYLQSDYFHFGSVLAGILILLLGSNREKEKEILEKINNGNLHLEAIPWISRYYKAFQDSTENRQLFKDFIHRHPE